MILPRSTMATASQVRSTSSSRCEDNTTVRPSATRDEDHVAHLVHAGRVEPVHRLVQDQQLRVPDQAGGDSESLAHAHRVLRHLVIGAMGEADAFERRPDAVACLPFACGGEDLEVLPPGQMAVEPRLVDDGPNSCQGHIAMPWNGVSEQRHRAGIGVGQTQQHADERGLAGAVRSEVAEGTSTGHEELDTVDRDVLPEALCQPMGLNSPLALRGLPVGDVGQRDGVHPVTLPLTAPVTVGTACTVLLATSDSLPS